MDKDLKDILVYGFGTAVGLITITEIINHYVNDPKLTFIYVLLTIIFIWLFYIQKKLSKIKGGKK